MKQFILIITAAVCLAACKDKKQAPAAENQDPAGAITTMAVDSTEIRKVITDFYTWYSGNYAKLMGYKLYSGMKKPDQPPYKINWDEVDKYQAFIRDSIPQFSEEFLVNQKKQFAQYDSAFKVDLEEELPYGFDYDWYTNSQEDPSYLLEGIKASGKWVMNVNNDVASVEIGAPDNKNYASGTLLLFVGLKKENGQWKIARIGND